MSLRERGCRSDQLPPTIDVNTLPERNTRVVVSMFDFHLYLGKIPNLTNIFQMGWNHQPEQLAPTKWWLEDNPFLLGLVRAVSFRKGIYSPIELPGLIDCLVWKSWDAWFLCIVFLLHCYWAMDLASCCSLWSQLGLQLFSEWKAKQFMTGAFHQILYELCCHSFVYRMSLKAYSAGFSGTPNNGTPYPPPEESLKIWER